MDKNKKAHDVLTSFLKNGKYRNTPERFQVLDAALDMKGHFGADDLFIEMKTHDYNVSRATVYNTLELLVKCEILVKRNFGDNITRYESNFETKKHDHIVCTNCGNIKEFSDPKIYDIINKICDEMDFEFKNYSFNIFGICKNKKDCKHFDPNK